MSTTAEMAEVRFVEGEFQRVVVGKDEVIVVMIPNQLTDSMITRLRSQLQRVFPHQECIVLEEGAKIGAVAFSEKEKK